MNYINKCYFCNNNNLILEKIMFPKKYIFHIENDPIFRSKCKNCLVAYYNYNYYFGINYYYNENDFKDQNCKKIIVQYNSSSNKIYLLNSDNNLFYIKDTMIKPNEAKKYIKFGLKLLLIS